MINNAPIITVTGTKGKTSLVRLLDYVFQALDYNVLRVDSAGAFYNGQLHFSDDDSRRQWGYAVTNAPGRFITLHHNQPGISLLEATLFSARTGLAYAKHTIGVFTNVYEDHLGATKSLQTAADIAEMKSFIFSKLAPDGTAIYNADDPLVKAQLGKLPAASKRIAVTLQPIDDLESNYAVTFKDKQLVILGADGQVIHQIAAGDWGWLKAGHQPSSYLALLAVAVLFEQLEAKDFKRAIPVLASYTFDPDGGRMITKHLNNGAVAILDYAHEKVSLVELATYARQLAKPGGRVIGVLRLAPSRTPQLVQDTAQAIYDSFDEYVIYDKVDGHFRQPTMVKGYSKKSEVVGRMAALFATALQQAGHKPVHTVWREDKALAKAIKLSCSQDVIVYIVGDDSARAATFIAPYTTNEVIV